MAPLMIAGAALSAVSSISNGLQAAAVGRRNAAILTEQARQTDIATAGREAVLRDRSRESLASQRVAMLQSGLDPSGGSALFTASQSTRDAELDALTLRYDGLMQSRAQRMGAQDELWKGKAARNQSFLSAAGEIVQGTGSYLSLTKAPKAPAYNFATSGYGGRY